jgi:hypothetical protein
VATLIATIPALDLVDLPGTSVVPELNKKLFSHSLRPIEKDMRRRIRALYFHV